MRVITGLAKGRQLETLSGAETVRPTSDRAKEGLFSAVQFHVPGANVLDLFAGSGQLGIEALSRGAARCTFVDLDREAVAVIKRNLNSTKLAENARVLTGDAGRFLESARDQYDIIFADPPYHLGIVGRLLPRIAPVVAPGGFVFCETEDGVALPDNIDDLALFKSYRYGKSRVWLYQNTLDPIESENLI